MGEAAPSFCIGSTANLIFGYKANWNAADSQQLPFHAPQHQGFLHFPFDTTGSEASWGPLRLALCATKTELFEKLCDYKVIADPGDTSSYPVGALLEEDIRSAQTIDQFFRETGIDLSKSSAGYALLTIERIERTWGHPTIEKLGFSSALFYKNEVMSHTLRRELVKLQSALNGGAPYHTPSGKWQNKTDAKGIQRFMDFFNEYGTHYVSKIVTGDLIYQIFAYEEAAFSLIQNLYQKPATTLNTATVLSFRKFSKPFNPLPGREKGYTVQIGHLCIKSKDERFLDCAAVSRWMDMDIGNNSIFNCSADPDQLLAFNQVIPIGFELAEILSFTRPVLKEQGNSIFKAIMFTKYGNKLNLSFKNLPANHAFQNQANQDTNNLIITTTHHNVNVYKNVLHAEDIALVEAADVKELRLLSPLFQIGEGNAVHLPGDFVHIMAHTLDAGGKPREVVLSDQAFNTLQLNCEDFNGALRIRNASNAATFTLVDGFKYEVAPSSTDSSKQVVLLRGEINSVTAAAGGDSLRSSIEHTLLMAENSVELVDELFPERYKIFVTRYLNWLFALLPAEDNAYSKLRLQAHWLARVIAKIEFSELKKPKAADSVIEEATHELAQMNFSITKNSLAIQQQLFHFWREKAERKKTNTDLRAKQQTLLLRMFRSVQSMTDNYAALSTVRQGILEKKHFLIAKLSAKINTLEKDVATRQALFLKSTTQLTGAIPAAQFTAPLKAIFQISSACLSQAAARTVDQQTGRTELAIWVKKMHQLHQLRITLLALTSPAVLNDGMSEMLLALGRNGLTWLREKEFRDLAEGFQRLIYQEFENQLPDYLIPLLEMLVNDFRELLHSGRKLMAAQASFLHIEYYRCSWDEYQARNQTQANALTALGALFDVPENVAEDSTIGTLTEIYHFHHNLNRRMHRMLLVLQQVAND